MAGRKKPTRASATAALRRKFECPKCGSVEFNVTRGMGGPFVRRCKGVLVRGEAQKPCPYRWEEEKDDQNLT